MLGANAYWRGDLRLAIRLSQEAEQAAAEAHDAFYELVAPAFACLAHITLGEYAEAQRVLERTEAKAREVDSGFILGRLMNSRGWLHQEFGDFTRALELDRESADIAPGARTPRFRPLRWRPRRWTASPTVRRTPRSVRPCWPGRARCRSGKHSSASDGRREGRISRPVPSPRVGHGRVRSPRAVEPSFPGR